MRPPPTHAPRDRASILERRNQAKAYLSISFCALLSLPASGQMAQSAQQRMEAVQNHLSRYVVIRNSKNDEMNLLLRMKELDVPAVSIAAIRNGAIDGHTPMAFPPYRVQQVSTETLFGAASISKPVTALGILKLVEEGKIDLDTNVNQYLKRWKIPENEFTSKQKVTVREPLNHTSGIGTHNGEIYDPAMPLPTLLQLVQGEKPAKTPPVQVEAIPGTKFAYSNGGYLALSLLIEDVTGEPFAQYMKQTVLMKHSTFDAPLPIRWQARAATAYGGDGKLAFPPSKFVEPNLAAGGLWSTPADLASLLLEVQREYDGKSHKVLNQQTVKMMVWPNMSTPSARPYGLGYEVGGSSDNSYVRHEGSAYFQDDMVEYLRGNGIVVMTSGGAGGTLAEEIIRSAGTVYDFPDFEPVEHAVAGVPASTLTAFVGTYTYIKVALDGDHLTAEIPEGSAPVRLYPESPTKFFVLDGPQEMSFSFDSQQKVTGLEFITPMGQHHLEKSAPQ